MSFPLDQLPAEVLHHVFSCLSVHDRLSSSLVCKKWFDILNCKSLLRDIKVNIQGNTVLTFLNMSRNFLNFEFEQITIDDKYHLLFKHFPPDVECLSFKYCGMLNIGDLKFDMFKNLKVLKIIECELWSLFPCLPNLVELHLGGRSIITDDGLAILQKTMKQLKTLTLDCNIALDRKVIKRFYNHGNSYETQPSSLILSLPALKSFISERVSSLKELNLYFAITSEALEEIVNIKNLCLTKICISKCYECGSSITELFKNQPSLKIIDLHALPKVNDDIIDILCDSLHNVEEISVHDCIITDKSLSKIFQLKNLKKLDIGRNHPIHAKFISKIEPIYLQSLNMSRISVENIDVLIKQCKNLWYLDLSYCKISDDVVHLISENLIRLKYLSLKGNDITDYGLTGLEIFELGNKENGKSLSNLKNLRVLKLNECTKITHLGLVTALHFKYLEYLYVPECYYKEDTSSRLFSQNPNIKKICCEPQTKNSTDNNKLHGRI